MKSLLAGVAFGALIALPGFAQDADVSADTVLATVGGETITLGHLMAVMGQLPAQTRDLPDQVLFDGILEQLVQQQAIANAASEQDIDRATELTLENQRRAILAGGMIDRIAMGDISDEALQAEYDAVYGSTEGSMEFNASHILVETEAEAQAVIDQLAEGADFAELAAEVSTGPSGPNGGALGWFSPGMMVPAFEAAVMGLEVNEVSAPVETQFGWHVVALNDTREQAAPTLDEVRQDLIQGLREERVAAAIDEMTNAATIERAEVDFDPSVIRNTDLLQN